MDENSRSLLNNRIGTAEPGRNSFGGVNGVSFQNENQLSGQLNTLSQSRNQM